MHLPVQEACRTRVAGDVPHVAADHRGQAQRGIVDGREASRMAFNAFLATALYTSTNRASVEGNTS